MCCAYSMHVSSRGMRSLLMMCCMGTRPTRHPMAFSIMPCTSRDDAKVRSSLTCCTSCWPKRSSHCSSSVLTMSSTMASALAGSCRWSLLSTHEFLPVQPL